MKISIEELETYFKEVRLPQDFDFNTERICTDTRKIVKGDIFLAIKGKNFDGNNYIDEALSMGAKAIMASDRGKLIRPYQNIPSIIIDSHKKALFDLSRIVLSKTNALKFAVTGSNGKTTTKDFLATLLGTSKSVLKTEGNYNNAIGLPMTLFQLTTQYTALVLEMGMSALGEIDELAALVMPEISVITNVGRAHLEFLKTIANIAKAKCEIIPHTCKYAIVNKDNKELFEESKKHGDKVKYFSMKSEADLYLDHLVVEDNFSSYFILKDKIHNEFVEIKLNVPGHHNIENFTAAYLAARLSGISKKEILLKVRSLKATDSRYSMEFVKGIVLIDDCYNANPDSMEVGLKNFSNFKTKGRKIALIGDMKELGADELKMHYEIGKLFLNLKIDKLLIYGLLAKEIGKGARDSGFKSIIPFEVFGELIDYLKNNLVNGDTLYIKGSHSMGLQGVKRELEN